MSTATYLTPTQVFALNEKHGWFQSGDAQSDVSKAFAQDAIEMHERIRAAAPDLLAALIELVGIVDGVLEDDFCCKAVAEHMDSFTTQIALDAIAKATGSAL